ncbi:MAG: WecB/TagA/CpsF family glycosyltransferase [Candidatus Omnitrophica bacterium]|nr:WecB/TagA/CpsF family glycosyltransferase [Candidatus Omnitrophota bacterium]
MVKTISLLGVHISRVNPFFAAGQICQWVTQKYHTYVCVAPVSTLVTAQRDSQYMSAVNGAGMVTPDGMPVVWLARAKGCRDIARTYGPDLMLEVCKQGQMMGLRHFFYGSAAGTLEKLEQRLKADYPKIVIAGSFAPGFQENLGFRDQEAVDRINQTQADILWVGLGSPKQDFWMQNHRPLLGVPVIVGAGAAFDFLSGVKPQAPKWMQNSGLEWLFRLICEPRRLWKRYLVGNTLFIYYVLKDFLKLTGHHHA